MEVRNKILKIKNEKSEIRFLNEMKDVLYDQKWLKTAKNFPVYYVWRGVKWKNDLRYDITVIPPRMLGKEFVKTKGNRNSDNFPELYTVLKGKAILLMQKMNGGIVKDVVAMKMEKGDWVIIPSDYALITINPSQEMLKTANWVSERNKNIYKELEKLRGACYFYTESGWVKNKNYQKVPKLRFKKPLKKMPIRNFLKFRNSSTGYGN